MLRSFAALLLAISGTAFMATGLAAQDVEVAIKTWKLPPASHYPHDAMVAADGSIWYSGERSNTLGRFDPETEQFTEFVTDFPYSEPHGLKEDMEGNVWFTASGAEPAYIGKLNPTTAEFTEYPVTFPTSRDMTDFPNMRTYLPLDESPRGVHSLAIDQKGTVWFSMFGANMLGRLVPSTGRVTVVRATESPLNPYDVQIDSKGNPWYALNRSNKLARVDPETMAVRTFSLPASNARPRRMVVMPDDIIWYADHARGYIGRFDPATEETTEWRSPGGEWSRPYAITAVGDDIWYSESWMDPSNLVRFDTKTETFQSWPVPDCFDGAYYMVHDSAGSLWFTCHETDRLVRVEIIGAQP